MKNKIEDLRDHLFATLEELRDEKNPMDVARAQAIAHVGRVIVETAKVEVAYLGGGRRGSGFIAIPGVEVMPEPKQIGGAKA